MNFIKSNTHEWYVDKVKVYHGDKVDVIGEYTGGDKPVKIIYHCELHGDTEATINAKNVCKENFLPCKLCQSINKSLSLKGKKSSDKEFYFKRLKEYCESHGGKLISKEWKTAKTIYEIKCENPEHPVFSTSADSLISGSHWCPYCCGRKGNFQEEIEQIIKNNKGTLMSEYKKSNEHVKVKCNIHNYIWDIMPLNIKKNRWCPICNLPFSEKVVWDYLNDNHILCDIQYKFNDLLSKNDEMLKFDFVIYNTDKSIKFLLEVDDCEHWYNHKSKRRLEARSRDKLKDEYCKNNNIILYRMIYPYKRNTPSYGEYYNYINSQLSNLIKQVS